MTENTVAPRPGKKARTIKAIARKKVDQWLASIEDDKVREMAAKNTILTGGAIASMLLGEPVNDFDIYFTSHDTALEVAKYYIKQFEKNTHYHLGVQSVDGRIKITTPSGSRGETAGDISTLSDEDQVQDSYVHSEELAPNDEKQDYRPVFLSTNAITLSGKIQIVLRFYGKPDEIHENYDFVHCTNYWTSWDGELVLRLEALESLMARDLRYVGSKYPLCSVIRTRKFIARGWRINAGQYLKMLMQLNALDLTSIPVLEDQLTGVDVAYFIDVIDRLKEKDPEKVNGAYLTEILNRMF